MTQRLVSYDCRFFQGDRPCIWHKREKVICQCGHYRAVGKRLLVIKLDAVGDVLRTTCILPVLKRQWPDCTVAWITHPDSIPLLRNNPYIQEVISSGPDALLQLAVRKFDIVIALDAGRTSASLASLARAKEKIGFVLHESGFVTATNPAAEDWLRMGIFDDLKVANRRTYQEIMCSILGLPTAGMAYVLELSDKEITAARSRLEGMGIDCNKPIVGIHTGGGGRWRFKQWNASGFRELIPQIVNEAGDNVQVLLFGGPLERELNRALREELDITLFDAGCDNELREFAALVKHCTVVLSGDSLAMHVALAVGSRVVVLFGPTSHAEIELFGQGEKVIPDLNCLVCYKEDCDFVPNCMDSISVDAVKQALFRQLKLAG
jgi:ADP-heptose:LPS heptosyltransferase